MHMRMHMHMHMQLSTLLMFYHESKWRRTRPDYSRRCVDDDVKKVLKVSSSISDGTNVHSIAVLLQISKLREELHWSSRAVDCLEKCLQVGIIMGVCLVSLKSSAMGEGERGI